MVENFLKYLEHERRYSGHTIISYKNDLAQFQKFLQAEFENSPIETATHNQIRSWVIDLVEKGILENSVNRKISSLKSFFKFLIKREVIADNPTTKIQILKKPKRLPKFVKEEEINSLLDRIEFPQDHSGLRDQLIIELLYNTGIRLSELTGLRSSDVNEFNGEIKVLGKRNKERIIPVSKNLIRLIKNYNNVKSGTFNNYKGDYLIVSNEGKKAYPMLIYRSVKKFLGLVSNLDVKSPHVLRHTFATHLLNKGAELNALKELLGHANLSATQIYTHNSLEKLRDVHKQAHPKA